MREKAGKAAAANESHEWSTWQNEEARGGAYGLQNHWYKSKTDITLLIHSYSERSTVASGMIRYCYFIFTLGKSQRSASLSAR